MNYVGNFGTTKYCNCFIKGIPCVNSNCLYLHEYAPECDCINKDDIAGGNKQIFLEQQKIAFDIVNSVDCDSIIKMKKRNLNNVMGHTKSKYALLITVIAVVTAVIIIICALVNCNI